MRRFLLFTLLICSLASLDFGQTPPKLSGPPLADPKLPDVYITFVKLERFGDIKDPNQAERLFFKITNNMRWGIYLDMSGYGDERFGDARLYHIIQDPKTGQYLGGSRFCHVCSENILGPGRSLTFSIPLTDIERKETLLRLDYKFEWEDLPRIHHGSYSVHSAIFSARYLPEMVIKRLENLVGSQNK